MSAESWGQLRTALRECHDFIEGAVSDTEIEPGEWCGAMHGARLLGHVTDAMLLATWIAGVAEAFEKRDLDDEALCTRCGVVHPSGFQHPTSPQL